MTEQRKTLVLPPHATTQISESLWCDQGWEPPSTHLTAANLWITSVLKHWLGVGTNEFKSLITESITDQARGLFPCLLASKMIFLVITCFKQEKLSISTRSILKRKVIWWGFFFQKEVMWYRPKGEENSQSQQNQCYSKGIGCIWLFSICEYLWWKIINTLK